MLIIILLILTLIVTPVVVFTLALCKSAALADRKLENLRAGILSDQVIKSKPSKLDIPTDPIRKRTQPS